MGDLLETHPDFSMNATLDRLREVGPLNPHAEMTLKGNAENSYCRSYIYELYRAIYIPEAEVVCQHLATLPDGEYPDSAYLEEQEKSIRDRFYVTPLETYRPGKDKTLSQVAANICTILEA